MEADLSSALLGIFSALFFAISFILIRKSLSTGESIGASIVATGASALVFLPFLILYYPNFDLSTKALLAFAVSGISANFLGRICVYSGMDRVGVSRTIPISRGSLIVAALLGLFILGETITSGHFLGIIILASGVMMVGHEIKKNSGGAKNTRLGQSVSLDLLFPVGAMFFLGFSPLFDKVGLGEGTPVMVGLAIRFSAAMIGLVGFSLLTRTSPIQPFKARVRRLYVLAGFASAIALGFFYFALSTSRIVVVMPFYSLAPIFVLVLSHFYLYRLEKITRILTLGTILVVTGAFLTGIYM